MKIATIFRSMLVSGVAALLSMGCVVDGTENELSYNVTVSVEGPGTAWSDVQKAKRGETVTVSAKADPEYMFSHWVVVSGMVKLSSETITPATFEMFATDVVIRAVFIPLPDYEVRITSTGNGTGAPDKAAYRAGETVTLTADPAIGYGLLQWTVTSGEATIADATANPATFIMPASDVEITAEFYAVTYPVTVENTDGGTAVADKAGYKMGETVTLTATADNGYAFMYWIVRNGEITLGDPDSPTTTFVMPASPVRVVPLYIKVLAEANSYITEPGHDDDDGDGHDHGHPVYIPISQANRVLDMTGVAGLVTTGLDRVTADNYTAELIWSDRPVGSTGVIKSVTAKTWGGEGYLEVTPGNSGNAVIGIRVGGKLRWSWHVWVTEDSIEESKDNTTGLTWMDRNLGAAGTTYDAGGKNGLFYQWGRKDAFPASNGTNNSQTYYTAASGATGITTNPATGSYTELPGMVQNPLVFATNGSFNGSLNVSGDTNDSWGGVSGSKTVFDPCPPGWKVPPVKVGANNSWGTAAGWAAWANSGRVFHGSGSYYPAAGYRNNNTGTVDNVGGFGYYWSATATSGANANHLYFYTGDVLPATDNYRSFGQTVRCVKE